MGVVNVVRVGVNVAPGIVACLPLIAVCNPDVFAMLREPSVIVGCFPLMATWSPDVLAMLREPSVIVGCLPSIDA